MELVKIYKDRLEEFTSEVSKGEAKYIRFSIVRLLVFIGSIGLLIFLFNLSLPVGFISLIVLLLGFIRFIKWHQKINTRNNHLKELILINQAEIDSINFKFSDRPNGQHYLDANHPYAIDLDIFGPHSIFQYTNRGTTYPGQSKYAEWLLSPASSDDIALRQKAGKELADLIDWRQNLQAYGSIIENEQSTITNLTNWLQDKLLIADNNRYKFYLWTIPIISIVGLVIGFIYFPWYIALLALAPAAYFLKQTALDVNQIHNRTGKATEMLSIYSQLLRHVETQSFESSLLIQFQKNIRGDKIASQEIRKLSYIISQLNVRYNVFAVILNLLGLWDLHWVHKLEKWKIRNKDNVILWFDAMANFEAITSIATTYYNHPNWTTPIIDDTNQLLCNEIRHPLIDPSKSIPNEFNSPLNGHIKLVTGSNMAGKSTFLRTIGLNIVLSLMGAPACAKNIQLPILHVYTSMRTQDDLSEATSSFYAELKRLKVIIQGVTKRDGAYFLLDEILKGTNSRDRHTGSRALIRQLINERGSGIIATHDLELTNMESESNETIENLCMEVEVVDNQLKFDYTLKKGVSQSFNATHLMRNMGISIPLSEN